MSGAQVTTWVGRELSGGRYRVDAQLGEGGMGTVFRAWDKNLSTEVVVKVPHASMLQDAEFAARFAREISSLVKLSHPHIVKISDVGEADGLPFAVMQFLPGGSLEDRQRSGTEGEVRPLPPESLKSWLVSIAEALDFVHSQGYIHRDVKPANILFDAHGHAYLSDFGIAKSAATGPSAASNKTLTGSGMVIGTPEYMAPELIMGQSTDGRVDQYALAVTVFEMLAGRRPFEDATSTALYVQHATAEPPDLTMLVSGASPAIAAAIHRALSKSPDQRFASCLAFAEVVLRAIGSSSVSKSVEVKAKCPVCQKVLKLSNKLRGKEVPCPGCQASLHVSDDLRLHAMRDSANETAVPATNRQALGARGTALVTSKESTDEYRLLVEQILDESATKPKPVTTPAQATQETVALGQPASRTKPIKAPAPFEWPSRPTTSPAIEKKPPTGMKWLILVAVGGIAVVLLVGITIFVMTDRGIVEITIKGGDDSIQVKVDGDEIAITSLDEPLKLSAGEHGLTVTSPRFETVTRSFKVTHGEMTVVEVELRSKATTTPSAQPAVAKAEPATSQTDKPAVYTVELEPPQAALAIEGDGITVTGDGKRRTVSVAKPRSDKSVILIARLNGFQEARRKLQPAAGASEVIVMTLSPAKANPAAVEQPVVPVRGDPQPLPAIRLQYISKEGVLLHFDDEKSDFVAMPRRAEIKAGDRIACPEPFRADLVVGDDECQIALIGGTAVTSLEPTDKASFGFEVSQGALIFEAKRLPPKPEAVSNAPMPSFPIVISLRGQLHLLELVSGDAVCGLEVRRCVPSHFETEPEAPGFSAGLNVARGIVRWTPANGKPVTIEGPGFYPVTADSAANLKASENGGRSQLILPDWLEPDPKRYAAKQKRLYNTTFEREFDPDQALLQSLPAIINSPRPAISDLAVKCLALTDSYQPLVKALLTADHREARLAAITGLRLWLPVDPQNRQLLKAEISRHLLPTEAEAVYRLLWGFNHSDAKNPATSHMLVNWLESELIAIRELAFWHVQLLTGLKHEYSPINPSGQRRVAVERWNLHLEKKGGALVQD